jgi:WXG100 family type VII secretion target
MGPIRTTPQGPGGYVPPVGAIHGGQGFETDTHVMVTAQQYISHVGQTMTSEVDKLISALEILHPRTWDGDAYRAFLKAKGDWMTAHDHIRKALGDIESCMGDSAKRYDQADLDSQLGIANAVKGLDYQI